MTSRDFRRLSFRSRGHVSNHYCFNPVERLQFGSAALTAVCRFGLRSVKYESASAEVLETYVAKIYGKGASAYLPMTLVTVRGPGAEFSFDVSRQFPDFREREEIIGLLQQHMPLQFKKQSLASVKRRHVLEILPLGILLLASIVVALHYGL